MIPDGPQAADERWRDALVTRDVELAAAYLHEDYALVLVHPRLAAVHREEWLRTLPDYVIHDWQVRQEAWDVRDDVAVHLHLVDMKADVFGVARNGPFALTDTWLRAPDGGWRVWRRHSTPLEAGDLPRG